MPAASRKGDVAAGHGCFPPTPAVGGSGDVFFERIPALRKGDMIFRSGDAEIVLRPNGDIDINGKCIKLNGEQIWLN